MKDVEKVDQTTESEELLDVKEVSEETEVIEPEESDVKFNNFSEELRLELDGAVLELKAQMDLMAKSIRNIKSSIPASAVPEVEQEDKTFEDYFNI